MNAPAKPAKPVRPRDAASVVLYRRRAGRIEILMGQRHAGHSFMPNRWVFPGGRVDRGDVLVTPATALRPEVEARMGAPTAARARALAVAAIRETYEEVGLIIGEAARGHGALTEDWKGFTDRGLAPALHRLDVFMRAITPAYSPKRFDARFFMADADKAVGEVKGSGELEGIRWVSIAEALELSIADITEAVIRETDHMLNAPERMALRTPVPVYTYVHKKRRVRHPTGAEKHIVRY